LLGAPTLADVVEHHQATPVASGPALEEHLHGTAIRVVHLHLTNVVISSGGTQVRAKGSQICPVGELGERPLEQTTWREAQKHSCCAIGADDEPGRIEADVAGRCQVKEIAVACARQLELCLGRAQLAVLADEIAFNPAQLLVLQLELDLVQTQLFDDALGAQRIVSVSLRVPCTEQIFGAATQSWRARPP
jgi:hypothetical protein